MRLMRYSSSNVSTLFFSIADDMSLYLLGYEFKLRFYSQRLKKREKDYLDS